jgi:CheY-like chemotaxis protein
MERTMAAEPIPVRILVVDNDPEMVSVLKREFGEQGWTVEEATSGRMALDALAREDVDVVLTDLVAVCGRYSDANSS